MRSIHQAPSWKRCGKKTSVYHEGLEKHLIFARHHRRVAFSTQKLIQLFGRVNSQLFKNIVFMGFHRCLRNIKGIGDVCRVSAIRQKSKNMSLARSKTIIPFNSHNGFLAFSGHIASNDVVKRRTRSSKFNLIKRVNHINERIRHVLFAFFSSKIQRNGNVSSCALFQNFLIDAFHESPFRNIILPSDSIS